MIDFRKLVDAGVHFGHETSRRCPKMEPYIWGSRGSMHLIDVSKTAYNLERAAQFIKAQTSEGKTILWVGTKKPAQAAIGRIAKNLEMPYVNHRWIGGILSNYAQVKKSITKLLHYEDILAKAEDYPLYTKKELNTIFKLVERLRKNVGGIRELKWPVGLIVIVDVDKENAALREAAKTGVPVVALVDTNGDPSLVDYVIPANDDASQSIEVILDVLAESAAKGKDIAREKKAAEVEEQDTKFDESEEVSDAGLLKLQAEDDEEEKKTSSKSKVSTKSANTTKKTVLKKKQVSQQKISEENSQQKKPSVAAKKRTDSFSTKNKGSKESK